MAPQPLQQPPALPAWLKLQRAYLNWFSHSGLVSVFSRLQVLLLKAVPLLSLLLVARRAWRLRALMRRLRKRPEVVLVKSVLEAWALLELSFWLYFHQKKRALEDRRAYQPSVLWKEPGERKKLLRSFLENINRIHAHNRDPGSPDASAVRRCSTAQIQVVRCQSKECTVGSLGARKRLLSAPSVENFLRYYDGDEEQLPTAVATAVEAAVAARDGSPLRTRSPSVEGLLHAYEGHATHAASSAADDAELRCLKHLELCSWYRRPDRQVCSDVAEIRRGNIEEWLLSYWFDGAESPSALTAAEFAELQELLDEVETWAGLPLPGTHPWHARNGKLRCFRLRNDPFPAVHRPLFVYAFTAFLGPLVGHRLLLSLGFRQYRSGSVQYYFRPPGDAARAWRWGGGAGERPHKDEGWRGPLVFCHGIGVGPTMCLSFLQLLVQGLGAGHPIFIVDMGPISMRFSDDVPGAREFAANLVDMLQVWGFKKAHFVGHSFGSFLLAWMLRYQRSFVGKLTFIDPVCFLLLKVLVEAHGLQGKEDSRMDTMEMGLKYFVLTELFICNFVCRCFFWEESQLDMRDLEGCDTLLVLESEDNLVPTHSVQRLVLAENARRARSTPAAARGRAAAELDVLWVDGQPHAGFLVDPAANREVCERLASFHAGSDGGVGS